LPNIQAKAKPSADPRNRIGIIKLTTSIIQNHRLIDASQEACPPGPLNTRSEKKVYERTSRLKSPELRRRGD